MAMYTRRNLQAGIGIMFPFTNNYKVGKERISESGSFPFRNIRQETGQMVVLVRGLIHSSSDASTRQATRG